MKVSICIAASDRVELLLGRCLPSILRQSVQDFEVVIVGDFIDEDNATKILEVNDARVSFHNLPKRGPYPRPSIARWQVAGTNAMNAALARAKGQYICHIDDDDEMAPDKLEKCLDKCQSGKYDFIHHAFFTQLPNRQWIVLGNGDFKLGQVTTGAVFYERRYGAIPWDITAFKRGTPGDWDRFTKIKAKLKPRIGFIKEPLLWHYKENNYPIFVAKPSEEFLEVE
jgi:glycosyltransferase involved in cell wall biosynthesis